MIRTSSQRVGLALIGLALGLFLAYRWRANPAVVDYPQAAPGDRATELQKTVDPNLADVETLCSVPGISVAVAKAIVEYREKYAEDHPGQTAFKVPGDLDLVKGVGQATIKKIEPYLSFP
jgi:DNA uptake protein ComE-like DNA-binding protein